MARAVRAAAQSAAREGELKMALAAAEADAERISALAAERAKVRRCGFRLMTPSD